MSSDKDTKGQSPEGKERNETKGSLIKSPLASIKKRLRSSSNKSSVDDNNISVNNVHHDETSPKQIWHEESNIESSTFQHNHMQITCISSCAKPQK